MALLFADGFDHYGGNVANLTKGAWLAFDAGGVELSTAQSRTGTHSLRSRTITGTRDGKVSRAITGGDSFVGVALGLYLIALNEPVMTSFELQTNLGVTLCQIKVLQSGALEINRTRNGSNIGTTSPVLTAGGWNHIEFQFRASTVIGSVEIRVNGVAAFSITNINTTGNIPTILQLGRPAIFSDNNFYDDIVAYNSLGAFNNTWLGVVRVNTIFPDANSTPQDWSTVGAGSAVAAINTPVADEGSYINSGIVGNNSKFSLQNLPAEISAIAAIYVPTFAKSDQAGLSQMRVRIESGAKTETGPVIDLLPDFIYQGSVFENNWTRTEFDAAQINFEKVG